MVKQFSLWLASLPRLIRISLLMESPAALPYSPGALILTLTAYIIVGFIALGSKYNLLSIIAQVGIEVLILAATSYLFLKIKGKLQRLLQTLYALIGVNLVISIISLIVLKLLAPDGEITADSWLLKAELLILLWNLAAVSLIFQRAFEIRTLLAAFAAFNYLLLYEFLLLNLF
jgi:hypothetical protein